MLRSFALPPVTPTKFHRIETPSYYDNTIELNLPFPFTISKRGVLDIQYIDSFEADMVTNTGNGPNTDPDVNVQLLGGTRMVQSLGDNFVSYIRAWRTTDAGTPVSIYTKGIVQRAQYTTDNDNHLGDSSYRVSTAPPTGDNYTVGSPDNNYRTIFLFKSPLTITTVESGITQYITFVSRLDED